MSAAPPPLNFITTLKDRRSAEYLLAEQPFGTYVTWCLGETEAKTFFVTYVSNIEKVPVHVQLTREAGEGSFRLTYGIDADERFQRLEDFIASRGYLDPARAAPCISAAPALTPAAVAAAPSLLRRRGGGGGGDGALAPGAPAARLPPRLAAAPPVPGVIPPDDDAAEMYDAAGVAIDESRYYRGVRPVCGAASLHAALTRVGWAGAALGCAVAAARLALHRGARTALVRASGAAESAVDAATGALYRALREGGDDVGACVTAVGAWRARVAAAGAAAAEALRGEPWALPYAWLLLGAALFAGGASLALFFVHTGRPGISLNATVPERGTREPLCRPNQGRWALAYFSLLGATLVAAMSWVSLCNGAADAPTAAGRAAATLSLRWPAAGLPFARPGAPAPPEGATPEQAAAWRDGVWGGAMTFAGAPQACLAAVARDVEPLVDGPPALPLPLPLALPWAPAPGRGMAWGWLHAAPPPASGALQLLMPTRAGIAHGGIVITAVYTFTVVLLLMGVEAWATQLRPMLLRWRAARSGRKAPAAKE
jgi:hypothetical protein